MKAKGPILFSFLALSLIFIWARFVEPNTLKVEEVNLFIEGFPEKGIVAVQISDVHMRGFQEIERKALEEVERVKPDFVFVTGDVLDWKTRDLEKALSFFEKLGKDERRVFFVFGNHEHENPLFSQFEVAIRGSEVELLKNEAREIVVAGDSFFLLGVDDPRLGFDDIEKTFEGVPGDKAKILLAHSPEIFRKVEGREVDLVLAGHTHGCQMNLPVLCQWTIPLKYDKEFNQGLFKKKGTYLYVNRGLGESFLPLRLNSFPELTVLRIKG